MRRLWVRLFLAFLVVAVAGGVAAYGVGAVVGHDSVRRGLRLGATGGRGRGSGQTIVDNTDAFDAAKADFSGMDGRKHGLFIGAAVHQAFVEVNEQGTEAAASTGISFGLTSMPPPPLIFRADHPFVFLIWDNQRGNILFMGRVVDPTH